MLLHKGGHACIPDMVPGDGQEENAGLGWMTSEQPGEFEHGGYTARGFGAGRQ